MVRPLLALMLVAAMLIGFGTQSYACLDKYNNDFRMKTNVVTTDVKAEDGITYSIRGFTKVVGGSRVVQLNKKGDKSFVEVEVYSDKAVLRTYTWYKFLFFGWHGKANEKTFRNDTSNAAPPAEPFEDIQTQVYNPAVWEQFTQAMPIKLKSMYGYAEGKETKNGVTYHPHVIAKLEKGSYVRYHIMYDSVPEGAAGVTSSSGRMKVNTFEQTINTINEKVKSAEFKAALVPIGFGLLILIGDPTPFGRSIVLLAAFIATLTSAAAGVAIWDIASVIASLNSLSTYFDEAKMYGTKI